MRRSLDVISVSVKSISSATPQVIEPLARTGRQGKGPLYLFLGLCVLAVGVAPVLLIVATFFGERAINTAREHRVIQL